MALLATTNPQSLITFGSFTQGIGRGLQLGALFNQRSQIQGIGKFNIASEKQSLNESLDSLSSRLRDSLSSQKAAAARSGISISSKSVLQDLSDTIHQFERAVIRESTASKNRQRSIRYQSDLSDFSQRQRIASAFFSTGVKAVSSILG